MNTFKYKDDLLNELPDYISGKIHDRILKKKIEYEISSNPEFEKIYHEFRETFSFLETSELEPPSGEYFSNLPLNIADKIKTGAVTEGFFQKFKKHKMLLAPAFAVLILIVSLYYFKSGDKDIVQETKSENVQTQDFIYKNEPDKNNIPDKSAAVTDEIKTEINGNNNLIQSAQTNSVNPKSVHKNKTKIIHSFHHVYNSENESPFPKANENLEKYLAENSDDASEDALDSDDDNFISNDDIEEEELEDEFQSLTPEQQHELIHQLEETII